MRLHPRGYAEIVRVQRCRVSVGPLYKLEQPPADARADPQRVLVIADITSPVEKWQRLGDGYRVEARFILWEGDGVLQVPASALFRHREEWAVFVAENGRTRLRSVRVGHRSGLAAEIVAPLKEGELVVMHPDDSLADGARISLRRTLRAS